MTSIINPSISISILWTLAASQEIRLLLGGIDCSAGSMEAEVSPTSSTKQIHHKVCIKVKPLPKKLWYKA